LAQYIVVTLL